MSLPVHQETDEIIINTLVRNKKAILDIHWVHQDVQIVVLDRMS